MNYLDMIDPDQGLVAVAGEPLGRVAGIARVVHEDERGGVIAAVVGTEEGEPGRALAHRRFLALGGIGRQDAPAVKQRGPRQKGPP